MSWANEEFETIDLGDKRLNRRTVLLAEQLAENPTSSIPGACKGWKETLGAYRLISNDKVNCQSVFTPHLESTVKRMAAQPVVLCVQDTTSFGWEEDS